MDKRRLRVLCSSDHHMTNSLPYARPSESGRTDRLDDQLAMWEQMKAYAAAKAVDGIFLLGDLFDKARPDPVTLVETIKAVVGLSSVARVYVLPGNHDAHTIRGGRFNVELFGTYERVKYLETGVPVDLQGVMFWPLEYMPVDASIVQLKELRDRASAITTHKHVLLFHNSVVGCEHLSWVCDDGIHSDEMCLGWDWVIGGHFHTHQSFGPKLNGMYCGAPMQHNFGDSGEERGFWDLTWRGNERKDKLVVVRAPRFWTADVGVVPSEAKPGDYIRWIVEATPSDFLAQRSSLEELKKQASEMGMKVDWVFHPIRHHKKRLEKPTGKKLTADDLIKRYVKSPDVEKGSLPSRELIALGRELLQEARRADQ